MRPLSGLRQEAGDGRQKAWDRPSAAPRRETGASELPLPLPRRFAYISVAVANPYGRNGEKAAEGWATGTQSWFGTIGPIQVCAAPPARAAAAGSPAPAAPPPPPRPLMTAPLTAP
jgi:hypothetical protein